MIDNCQMQKVSHAIVCIRFDDDIIFQKIERFIITPPTFKEMI